MRGALQTYEQYKDSGIEWIGKIPQHWEVPRIYDVAIPRKIKNIGMPEKNLLSLSYGKIIRKDIDSHFGLLPESFETYQIIEKGDIILRLTDLQNDQRSLRVGLVKEKGIITSAYLCLQFLKTVSPTFAYYLLYSFDISKVFYWFGGGLRQSMKFDDVKVIPFVLPSLTEQKEIAHYLDTKTAQIDRKIDLLTQKAQRYEELKRALINETVTRGLDKSVPMKDSGIEWIGEIPEHWNVLPLKDLASNKANSFVDGPFGSDLKSHEHTEYGIPLIQLNNIGIGTHYIQNLRFISEQKASSLSRHKAYPGELAIAKMAEPVARAAVIRDDYPFYVIVADCIKLNPNQNIALSCFLVYALNSIGVKSQAEVLSNGTTRIRIGLSTAKILKIALPPLLEQEEIVEYLDQKTADIDRIVENINSQVEIQKELRKTLINDVVTGKIKVIDN